MQRVAIARALVNNPDILLADEPTGALDSDTSIQVMDLLREVAKDRLVVMVTHNPELAQQYATRIVNLRDGKIRSDSDPLLLDEKTCEKPKHKNMGKSSMSFLTALALSFNNLKTKKARTILTSFAGSIGIIGIALILALSTGVNDYIQTVEEETLSEYPLQIQSTGFDMASMLTGTMGDTDEKPVRRHPCHPNDHRNVLSDGFQRPGIPEILSGQRGKAAWSLISTPSNTHTASPRRFIRKTAIPSARFIRTVPLSPWALALPAVPTA